MPKIRPELAGEPLGWDFFNFTRPDGTQTLIERAVEINDLCNVILGPGLVKVLLCYFKSEAHGQGVAVVEVMDLLVEVAGNKQHPDSGEFMHLSEEGFFQLTSIDFVLNSDWRGVDFVETISRRYEIEKDLVRRTILENVPT